MIWKWHLRPSKLRGESMFKYVLLGFVGLALSACATLPEYVTVESTPDEVLLKFPDGSSCETPCPIIVTHSMKVSAAKAGYIAQEFILEPGQRGSLMLTMELAAPTKAVEEEALPDL